MSAETRKEVIARHAATVTRVPCAFCGADDPEPLSDRERYGAGFPTGICRQCSLIYLTDRWPDEVYTHFYEHDYRLVDANTMPIAERYARQLAKAGRIIDFCAPFLPGPDGAILDVGCSTGAILETLGRTTGARVVGIDPSVDESAFARERGIDVRPETLESAGLEPGTFDLVLLMGTIDHLFDPFGDLRRIRRFLKPTGHLFVSIGDVVELAKWRHFPPFQLDHLTYYTSATLRDLVQRIGFQAVRWRANTAAEAALRHRDELLSVGPILAIEGVLRVEDEPILFAQPSWQSIKQDFVEARRSQRSPTLAQRALRRAYRYAGA